MDVQMWSSQKQDDVDDSFAAGKIARAIGLSINDDTFLVQQAMALGWVDRWLFVKLQF
jgi:hypothetical protein